MKNDEIGSKTDKILAVQKKMGNRFYFQTPRDERINSVLKIISEFIFFKITQGYTQSSKQLYHINIELFGIICINVRFFMSLHISNLNFLKSLIILAERKKSKDYKCLLWLLFFLRRYPKLLFESIQFHKADITLCLITNIHSILA